MISDNDYYWKPGGAGRFLFFMYVFHTAVPITYWFAIDIRYRSSIRLQLFSIAIANRDIDSER
ncbi:MAG: hypothetical protein BECKG1743F_GA0114225_109752 [Candidatus Kentron sp. G]|nr:MAG: hypothetical protein BECKG1743F_GA0114225_109752 [Candidatus Kentron sp. G]VFN05111.1 MAG: hypothetical protein BECKG1743E_GA0114224_108222 [Candidatus Kentron sp. G]